MNKLLRLGSIAIVLLCGAPALKAQTTLIDYWNFNTLLAAYNNPNIPALSADFSATEGTSASIVYMLEPGTSSTYTGFIDNFPSTVTDTINLLQGAVGGQALRVRNPSDSMELRFYLPTTGYGKIALNYAVQSSSAGSGQLTELFDYSIDSGLTWKTSGLNMTSLDVSQAVSVDPNWMLVSLNFGSDLSVENNPGLVFRIKFSGNTSLAKGNNRFDNVALEGVKLPSAVYSRSAGQYGFTLSPNPARDHVVIAGPMAGGEIATIVDLMGRVVGQSATNGNGITLNTSALPKGTYFIRLRESNGAGLTSLKFSKE